MTAQTKIQGIADILSRLSKVKEIGSGEYEALCPAHDDKVPSLHIKQNKNKILLSCKAGCTNESITKVLGLTMSNLFLDHSPALDRKIVATYPYHDADGKVIYEVVRFEPKGFSQRRPNGKGGHIWNLNGATSVLYHLPDIIQASRNGDTIFLVEGEKDADSLWSRGLIATTNPMGASKWRDSYTQTLTGTNVIIIPDSDEAGINHAKQVAKALRGKAQSVKILQPFTEARDVSDWLSLGHTVDELKLRPEYVATQDKVLFSRELIDRIADTGFLKSYVDYAVKLTDAPRLFHLGTALSIIGTALGNRVYFRQWGQNIYCHLWNVVLSPSGYFRKSTAQRIGLGLLRKALPDSVLPSEFSGEALLDVLAGQSWGIFHVSEFASLLARFERDYMKGTKEMLADLWDSPAYYKKKLRQYTAEIRNPAISLLGASTLDWLENKVTSNDLRGGFFSRVLFFPAIEREGWKGITLQSQYDVLMADELSERLKEIGDLQGEADFSLVIDDLNAWVKKHEESVSNERLNPELIGFFSRQTTYAIKLSIILQVSIDKSLVITKEALDRATLLLDAIKESMTSLITKEFALTKEARELRKLKEIIASNGGEVDRRLLLQLSHMMAFNFDRALNTLEQTGEVRIYQVKTAGRPRIMAELC